MAGNYKTRRTLSDLERRLVYKATETGSCDPTDRDDLRFWKGWQKAKKNLISAGVLSLQGGKTTITEFVLQEGTYEINSANTTKSVSMNPVTISQLNSIMDYLNNPSINASINFCVAFTYKKLGLDNDNE